MKVFRIFAFVAGGFVLLVALGAILVFTPAVQTWAVRKALAGQPGMTAEIGRVSASLSAAEISNVRIAQDGAIVTIQNISARYSAWDYLTKKTVNAESVIVQNVVLDLRHHPAVAALAVSSPASKTPNSPASSATPPSPVPAPAARPASPSSTDFAGLLKNAQLPLDVRIARFAVQGRALLPAEKTATFDLQGADLQNGARGKIDWKADLADPQPGAPVSAVRSAGTVGIRIAADRRIELVELEGDVSATGPNLPPDRLQLQARAAQAGADETYAATLRLVRGTAAATEPLLRTEAAYRAATRDIAGTWTLSVRSEQLAALLAGMGLPEIAATGTGTFTVLPATGAISAAGNLDANLSRLEKIFPELASIGAVQLKASFDGGLAGSDARLERLQLEITGAGGRKFAEVRSMQRIAFNTATSRVALANPGAELARVALQAIPLAWAQPFVKDLAIESGDLSLTLAVEAEADGSRIRARATEPLAMRNVTVRNGDKKLADQVTLTARPRIDYSAEKIVANLAELNVSMPTGDALTGTVDADVTSLRTTPAIAFSSDLQLKIVAALKPYLPLDPGPLAVRISSRGRHAGNTLQLEKLSVLVDRDQGVPLLAVELQQAVSADLARKTFLLPNPQAPAARLKLGEVPLAWAQGFVAKSQLAGVIAGATLEVTAPALDNLTVKTVEPLLARGITATLDGKRMVQAIDLAADLTATLRGETVAYEIRRFELKQGEAKLAGLVAAGELKLGAKFSGTAKGTFETDTAALGGQPFAATTLPLARGTFSGTFDAALADAIQAKATIAGRNLVARQENRPLGNLDVSLDVRLKPEGGGTVSAPIVLTNGPRRSDVSLQATFDKSPEALQLTGRIAGDRIFVDDLQALAALAPATPAEKPAATPTPAPRPAPRPANPAATPPVVARDATPFWKGVRGKVDVDLKQVIYGKDYPIQGLRGSATIADNRIALETLEGRLKENPFKASGAVTFNAQQPKPYTLQGAADVQNFDVGEFLRAANPNERPAIESKVNVVAKLNGTGATVGELGKGVYGQFDLTGSQGVLRALGRKTEMASAGSALLGLAGALTNSNTTVAIAEVTRALAELKFDTFKMQVERSADLSFKLSNIEFISALMRTTGNGRIVNRGTGDVQNQPMEILLQFGAKDQLAQLLARAGVLGETADDKGYQLLQRTFTLGGTPAKPDSNALWKYLLGEAATRGLPALQDLLNRR